MQTARVNGIILRYLLIFLAFSMLLLSLYIPIYRYVNEVTTRNVLERMTGQLENGVAVLDTTMTALNNAIVTTSEDARFRVFKYATDMASFDPLALVELNRTFKGLVMPQELIADAGILFSDAVVLTRHRSFYSSTYYTFYPEYLQCGGLDFDRWRALLESGGVLQPARSYQSRDYGTYEALTYARRWSATGAYTESLFYATLPVEAILRLCAEPDVLAQGFVRAFDSAGRLLIDHQYADGPGFRILHARTLNNQMVLEVGVPEQILLSQLRPVKRMMLGFSLLVAAFTLSLVVIFALRSSKPMQRLLGSVGITKHVRGEFEARRGERKLLLARLRGEYDDLASSIAAIDDQIDQYKVMIDRQKDLLRVQMMERALQRGLYGAQEQRDFATAFPSFPETWRLALLRYELPLHATFEENAAFQAELVRKTEQALSGAYAQGLDGNALVVLLPTQDEEKGIECLRRLCGECMEQFGVSVDCVLGGGCASPTELARAYQQLQYAFSVPQHLIRAGQVQAPDRRKVQLPLSVASLQVLYGALSSGNEEVALAALEECGQAMPWEDYATVRHTHAMIARLLAQLKLEYPAVLFEIIIPSLTVENARDLFERLLPACFGQICARILAERRGDADAFAQSVLAYLHERLFHPDLYIGAVSEHFNISAPTLQKIVKNATGQTFSAYVEDKRLAKAYRLLTQDRLPVRDVAQACGFSNANSFYKAFKRKYAVSPNALLSL